MNNRVLAAILSAAIFAGLAFNIWSATPEEASDDEATRAAVVGLLQLVGVAGALAFVNLAVASTTKPAEKLADDPGRGTAPVVPREPNFCPHCKEAWVARPDGTCHECLKLPA